MKYASQYERTPSLASPDVSALLFYAFGCLPGNISTVMLRRKAWESVGGFWEGKQQAPDFDMWVRVSERWNVAFIDEPLVELREHELQLGRLGQKIMTTIEEELRVTESLRRRLRGIVPDQAMQRFWRDNRGRQHVHWVMRALCRGDFLLARKGWNAVKQYGSPYAQAAKWLISLNGRLRCERTEVFFDRFAKLIGTTPGSRENQDGTIPYGANT
jgi:hypothetical protein